MAEIKPKLKEVIVRIDFPRPVEMLQKDIPKEIEKEVIPLFPIKEPKPILGKEFQFSGNDVKAKDIETKEWNFFGQNREKRLIITDQAVLITYKSYGSFDVLKNDFLTAINALSKSIPDIQINRMGLRYINELDLNSISVEKWDEVINSNLIHFTKFDMDKEKISRIFSAVNFTYDNMKLNFQFGISNVDFPAPIINNLFILDYDAYYEGLIEKDDIIDKLEIFHNKIKQFFEGSLR